MKKLGKLTCVALVLLLFSGSALALIDEITQPPQLPCDDLNPPEWRGEMNTTLTAMSFPQSGDPGLYWAYNPPQAQLGTPQVTLPTATSPFGTWWLDEFNGRYGVWKLLAGELATIAVDIPNFDNDNPFKYIWVQVVYGADAPLIIAQVDDQTPVIGELVDEVVCDDGWCHATYQIELQPNPSWETVFVGAQVCNTYIDCMIIDTWCVPEPASIAVLSLGGLLLRRRKA